MQLGILQDVSVPTVFSFAQVIFVLLLTLALLGLFYAAYRNARQIEKLQNQCTKISERLVIIETIASGVNTALKNAIQKYRQDQNGG